MPAPVFASDPRERDIARNLHAVVQETEVFRGHMLFQLAGMSVDDGLVMQLHPGAVRNHNRWLHQQYGHDVGGDIPQATDCVHGLAPLLDAFGNYPRLRLVLYTLDEDTYSRELAPLAGGYAAVYLGAPWWFLDTPYDEAAETIADLAYHLPKKVFRR